MIPIRGWTRETRLLVVTVVLSVSVLLALARLRFPDEEPAARLALPARPLQQIIERASFDDLTGAVSRAADRIRPALMVASLRAAGTGSASVGITDWLSSSPPTEWRALAIYAGDDRWVSIVPAVARAGGVATAGITLAGRDPVRGLLVLQRQAREAPLLTTSRPTLPAFLVVAEPTAAGVSVRPLFVAATATVTDDRWRAAVWPLPDDGARPGALVFSLEGAFVGGVTAARTGPALVPADTLLGSANRLEHDRIPWSIGVRLQPLDAGLRAALDVSQGVVVAGVDPAGAAAGALVTGDVITSIDGTKVDDPWDVLQRVAAVDASTGVDLEIAREGTTTATHIAGSDRGPAAVPPGRTATASARTPAASIGAQLVPSSRGSRLQRVDRDGPAARAGLAPGDEIWWVQGTPAASPAAIARRWRALAPGGRLAVGVDPATPRLLAIERP